LGGGDRGGFGFGDLGWRLVPVSDRAIRLAVLFVSVVLLGWAALAGLTYFHVLPRSPRWLLLNVTVLGLILHVVWWVVAVALIGLAWVVNRFRFKGYASW
jgi:hypothetical protein